MLLICWHVLLLVVVLLSGIIVVDVVVVADVDIDVNGVVGRVDGAIVRVVDVDACFF